MAFAENVSAAVDDSFLGSLEGFTARMATALRRAGAAYSRLQKRWHDDSGGFESPLHAERRERREFTAEINTLLVAPQQWLEDARRLERRVEHIDEALRTGQQPSSSAAAAPSSSVLRDAELDDDDAKPRRCDAAVSRRTHRQAADDVDLAESNRDVDPTLCAVANASQSTSSRLHRDRRVAVLRLRALEQRCATRANDIVRRIEEAMPARVPADVLAARAELADFRKAVEKAKGTAVLRDFIDRFADTAV